MLQDDILRSAAWGLTSEEVLRVKASYKSVAHFFMDTRGNAYLKGCGSAADKAHTADLEYPHMLMGYKEFVDYFSKHCPRTAINDCYPQYAKSSVDAWWSGQYRRYRTAGLSPYLASFFSESDSLYVPRWAVFEHSRWERGTYRADAMMDNLMLVSQEAGVLARSMGCYQGREIHSVRGYPYAHTECKILGPAGLALGDFSDQGGTKDLEWTLPLFRQIPMLDWILSRSDEELFVLYNLRPPETYEPKDLPEILRGYVPYAEFECGVAPFSFTEGQ